MTPLDIGGGGQRIKENQNRKRKSSKLSTHARVHARFRFGGKGRGSVGRSVDRLVLRSNVPSSWLLLETSGASIVAVAMVARYDYGDHHRRHHHLIGDEDGDDNNKWAQYMLIVVVQYAIGGREAKCGRQAQPASQSASERVYLDSSVIWYLLAHPINVLFSGHSFSRCCCCWLRRAKAKMS